MSNTNDIGKCVDCGQVVQEANAQRPGFLPGRNTTWGYWLRDQPEQPSDELASAITLAREWETAAREQCLVLSSETDNDWEAFVVPVSDGSGDLGEAVKGALGLASGELLVAETLQRPPPYVFFDTSDYDLAREYLEVERDVEEPSDEQVLEAIGASEEYACYTDTDVAAYKRLAMTMAKSVDNLQRLHFDYPRNCKFDYTVSPVIVAGIRNGFAVGLWANRVRT